MQNDKNKRVLSNFIWRFLERSGAQIVTFLVTIILARILEPSVYGEVAIVTVIISLLQVFVDSGLGVALIQKKEADDEDFSTVFYFNLIVCLIIYGLLFITAPLVEKFFLIDDLTPVIRVSGFIILISSVKNVQHAYVSKNMMFKKFFFATLGGTICAALMGVLMALWGFGIWALVSQNICNHFIDTIILWHTVKWRPKKVFSKNKLRGLLQYGWKILATELINELYREARQIIIGKRYTTADLAFYNRGEMIPGLVVRNINTSLDSVLFPSLSEEQNDNVRLKTMVRKAIKTGTYIMMPLLTVCAVCADSIVVVVLGDKWLPCVPYLRIFCISYCFHVIHTANLMVIRAVGRSDISLKVEVIKKIFGFSLIVGSMWFGVFAMAMATLVDNIIAQIINSWPNKKLINYPYLEQMTDVFPHIMLSVGIGTLVYVISFLPFRQGFIVFAQLFFGSVLYCAASRVLRLESYYYICDMLSGLRTLKTKEIQQ